MLNVAGKKEINARKATNKITLKGGNGVKLFFLSISIQYIHVLLAFLDDKNLYMYIQSELIFTS